MCHQAAPRLSFTAHRTLTAALPPVLPRRPSRACSRAFIRAASEDEDLPVPSPTFLLQNMYTEHAGAAPDRPPRWLDIATA